jgi:hypothetical protein
MQLAADGVGFHADADQVVGVEHLQGLGLGEGHLQVNSNGGRGIGPNLGRFNPFMFEEKMRGSKKP